MKVFAKFVVPKASSIVVNRRSPFSLSRNGVTFCKARFQCPDQTTRRTKYNHQNHIYYICTLNGHCNQQTKGRGRDLFK